MFNKGNKKENRKNEKDRKVRNDYGFTLLEVLFSLIITGIFLSFSLRLFIDQWNLTKELKDKLEIQYSVLNAGKIVSDAIRSAQTIAWKEPGVLKVLPWPESGTFTTDSYYIDDKDRDGVKDVYWEHLNVANPLASSITGWMCKEVEPGLWEITIEAMLGRQKVKWQSSIRQRTYPIPGG